MQNTTHKKRRRRRERDGNGKVTNDCVSLWLSHGFLFFHFCWSLRCGVGLLACYKIGNPALVVVPLNLLCRLSYLAG